ncbi:MAG TPA: sensor histidine kinase [Pelobium sp.]|nr:sensor histidine kinase [Pelobium sp.]
MFQLREILQAISLKMLIIPLGILPLKVSFANNDIDSLKNLLKAPRQVKEMLLAELCWEYKYSQPDSAKYFGSQAVNLASKNKNPAALSVAYHNLAVVYEAQSDFEEAIKLNQKSLEIKKQIGDKIGVANSLNNLGGIYDQKGNYPKAVALYKQAYTIYKNKGDRENVAMINLNLGIVLKAQKEYKKVLKYYREAHEIYKGLNKPFETGASEANLGSVFLKLEQYDSCIFYSKLAEQCFINLKIEKFLPVVRANIGIAYGKKNQLMASNSYLQKAIEGHRKFNDKKELSFALVHLAENHKGDNYPLALSLANQALQSAEDCASLPDMMEARKLLAELYQSKGNIRLSLENFTVYSELKDSLFTIEKNKELNQFNIAFETEKKDRKITELNQQSTIQKLQIKEKNILIYAALVLLGFSIFCAYLIVNKRKIKAQVRLKDEMRKQQELRFKEVFNAEERERRRIAEDLHDGVGQTLSAALMNLNGFIAKTELKDEQQSLLAEKSVALLTESYDEMRSISHQMIPNALLKSGLVSAVREFLNKIDQQELKINLDINGLQDKLDDNIETVIYRVIQEATNNVIKYAKATKLSIQISRDDDGISVSIEDNGIGFNSHNLKNTQGIGFKNMQNRVTSLNGTLEIDSEPGKGTLLNFYLPA